MKTNIASLAGVVALSGLIALASVAFAQTASAAEPYKIVKSTQTMGTGGIDYVYADNDSRRLYVPRGNQVLVFDLDTLKSAGAIANARARGVAVDPKSQHGFCSSSPVVMWDAKTLADHQDHRGAGPARRHHLRTPDGTHLRPQPQPAQRHRH